MSFDIVSDTMNLFVQDHTLVSPTLDPYAANPLVQGAWLEKVGGAQEDRAQRGSANPATDRSYPVWSERGRTDTQALGKAPLIMGGWFEADTDIFLGTGITLGEDLVVNDVTIGGLTRRGLIQVGGGGGRVVAYCSRLPADNGGLLRLIFTLG